MAENEGAASMENDAQQNRYLTFAVEKEVYGIEIRRVREIIGMQKISSIPGSSDSIEGIINLRGNIIPVMDMRRKLKKEPIAYDDRTCIVVIEIDDAGAGAITAGLIVDRVSEVVIISGSEIVPPPRLSSGAQYQYISGIGKIGDAVRLLLNCEKLVTSDGMGEPPALPQAV